MRPRTTGYFLLIVLAVTLLVGSCARVGNREKLARLVLETLLNNDWDGFSALVLSHADMKAVDKAVKKSQEYQSVDQKEKDQLLEALRLVSGRMVDDEMVRNQAWRKNFDDNTAKMQMLYGIETGKVKLVGIEEDSEYNLYNLHGFSVFRILFQYGAKQYRIDTEGVMESGGTWKLVSGITAVTELGNTTRSVSE